MELKNFDQLVSTVKGMSEKRVVAVAAAADQHVIESVLEAKQEGIAQPILVGDAGEIKKIMGTMGLNPSDFDIVDAPGTPADAAVKAVETVDTCAGRVAEAVLERKGTLLITADHGNADKMYEPDGSPFTAHTTNLVPFCVVGYPCSLREGGRLADIAPTMLHIMGLPQPDEMDGRSLIL